MDTLRCDVVLAVRGIRQAPGVTAAIVAILALAIAATAGITSVVHVALARPLPHIDVDRWAHLYERPINEGLDSTLSVSVPNYRDWRDSSRAFTAMVLWRPWSFNLAGDAQAPERLRATIVTPNLFTALRLTPAAGRLLQDGDDPLDGRRVLISHALWERRFGSDPAIVGQPIRLNHVPHVVVGVAPAGFTFPLDGPVDVWVPESMRGIAADTYRDARGMQVSALLRDGATWDEARGEMDRIAARLAATYPEDRGFGVTITPMRESLAGDIRRPLVTLLAALGLIVLLIAVNLANLQLARLDARRHEFGVRAALGASRWRLVRQAVVESALLAAAAGALGLLAAPMAVRGLMAFVPAGELAWLDVRPGATMILAAVGVAAVVTLLAGVIPVLRGVGADVSATLARAVRGSDAGSTGRRIRQASIVAQLALSLAVLVSAALVIQTFVRLRSVDPGFDAAGRMTLSYFAPRARYADAGRLVALVDRVREEVGRAPGVRAVGLAQALPFAPGAVWLQALTRDDPRGIANLGALPHVHYNVVSAGYAEALGVPVKAGRTFDATDAAGSPPVAVINEALARRFFPDQDPIGQTISVGHAQALPALPRRTIVGIVGDARWSGLDEPAGPEAWVPFAQQSGADDLLRTMYVVFRAAGDAAAAMPAVRAQIARADPDLPLTSVRTLASRLDETVWRQRLAAVALGTIGLAALAVALMGVLAVTSYLVGRRAHEMGVRLALGAPPPAIVRMVLAESGGLVLLGTGLGVLGALGMGRLLATMLYGVSTTDLPTFLAASTLLAATAIAACYLPARRASRVDPLVTLRAGHPEG
jgi:putative ABC transport system permease protein